MSDRTLTLDGQALTPSTVEAVARHGRGVRLGDVAARQMQRAARFIADIARGDAPVYGVNTGFGSLAQKRIAPADVRQVQRNLIRSHSAGVGEPLDEDAVRAMLLCLAASLSRGHSGVRTEIVELIAAMLNAGITPVVPSRGSVGASGDLAPLSHAALALIGEGQVRVNGEVVDASKALGDAGLEPVTLEAKEGLALINGTHLMAGLGALVICDLDRVQSAALCAAAMAIDANRATDAFLDGRVHDARAQPGQSRVAEKLRAMLHGSEILASHRENDPRVQDPYSLRASPQVLGAAFDAIAWARGVIETELGAVTDNPLIFPDHDANSREVVSGGNFHGMPLAIALDTLSIAMCHIAQIAERRVYWLLAASDGENPVNTYLSPQPGLHSGMMITQYTAAACCNELQTLATPASVANLPTSAGMEDYNSMGTTAAHQARAGIDLLRNVIAIELLVMTEAMEYQRPKRSGAGVERTYETVRSVVPRLTEDRPPAPDIAAIAELISQGAFDVAFAAP